MADAEIIRIDAREREEAAEAPKGRLRCRATTSSGRPCRNTALPGSEYCRVHHKDRPGVVPRAIHPEEPAAPRSVGDEDGSESFRDFIRRRLAGDYDVDAFGYDPHLAREFLIPLLRPLYENYFR